MTEKCAEEIFDEQWYALDDITGKDFLFMFTGKYQESDYDSVVQGDSFAVASKSHMTSRLRFSRMEL